MRQVLIRVRKFAIFCHRWMGLAFCVLFAWWFASGIFMMYWDFPSVGQGDRLDHSEPIDASRIRLSPEEAFAKLGREGSPGGVQLAMFDGRPVYRFTMGGGGGRGGRGGGAPRGGGTPNATALAQVGAGGRGGEGSRLGRGRGTDAGSTALADAGRGTRGGFGRGFGRGTDRGGRGTGRFSGGFGRGRRGGKSTQDGDAGQANSPEIAKADKGSAPPKGDPLRGAPKNAPQAAANATPEPAPQGGRGGGRGGGQTIVYADDGSVQGDYSKDLLLRIAARWTGQPADSARVEEVTATDQWTVQGALRNLRPLWKYRFRDGQQVYVNGRTGEVVQYTTLGSRIGAELGPIPHWIYYTPLRVQQKLWSNLIIYASGIGTVMALMGLIVGISLYSPSKRYRFEGAPTTIPYTGQKRLHMILGLFFGILACTWAFSGMLSMDPFPATTNRGAGGGAQGGAGGGGRGGSPTGRIQAVLRADRFQISDYADKFPQAALAQMGNLGVKQLDFTSFDGLPLYQAALSSRETRIIPVHGAPRSEFDKDRVFEMVTNAARPVEVAEQRLLTQYDAYYLDRHHDRPLPVLFVRLSDPENTQLYIDQRTGRVVGEHSNASSWVTRWLYHGLHSMDFPWLYNYRPAWDIVVLTLMFGGLSLCVTSVIMGWQLLRRKLTFRRKPALAEGPAMGD